MKARVKADLDRDVRLGVLEKVNVNLPVNWLSRMLVTMKKDGSPCRIIDFKNINNAVPRQTNITQSPAASMTESIMNFPAPKNITQARAFFGLVEQVSFTFSKYADMFHFRHLLSRLNYSSCHGL